MFAKLAQFCLLGGRTRPALALGGCHSDDDAGCRPINTSHRIRQPILVCHWHKARPTGALAAGSAGRESPGAAPIIGPMPR
jgi:hypothetical protein